MPNKIAGLSLLEMMVALLLSTILLASSFYLLQYSTRFFRQLQQQIQLHHHQQYAYYFLSKAIRMAGLLGCTSLQHGRVYDGINRDNIEPLFIYQPHHYPAWLKTSNARGEVLAVTYSSPTLTLLAHDMPSNAVPLTTAGSTNFPADTATIITDCQDVDLFLVQRRQQQQLYSKTSLSKAYAKGSLLAPLLRQWFYLAPDTDRHDNGLFRRDQTGHTDELVSGLRTLQFRFMTGQFKQWVTAAVIKNWLSVTAVEINIVYADASQQTFTVRVRNT